MVRLRNILLAVLISCPVLLYSQEDTRKVSLDIGGGASYSHVDINSLIGYYGNLGVKYNLSNQFGLKANLGTGLLKGGEDEFNRAFENQFFQYSLRGVFNISQLANIHETFPKINLHAYAGVGNMHNNAEDTRDYPEGEEPRPNYEGTNIVLPLGLNLEIYLSKRLDLFGDIGFMYSNNDQIDGYDPSVASNQFADAYSTYTVGLSYKFGEKSKKHSDWATTGFQAQIDEIKDDQKQKISKIEQKIDKLQAQIERLQENRAEKDEVQDLETRINKEIKKIEKSGSGSKGREAAVSGSNLENMNNVAGLSHSRFIHVIGSFKDEADAKEFAKEIEQKGYNPGILYNYYNGRWYYVHINQYKEFSQAREDLKKVREELDIPDAWMYYRSADDLEKYKGQ